MAKVYLSLGSNKGRRYTNLTEALKKLAETGTITAKSSVWETVPWGVLHQKKFLNICAELETELSPQELLEKVLQIEAELGRVRKVKWGPRTIDIDILTYDDAVIESENLWIPHKYMHLRSFVLTALKEIAPDFIHPVFQKSIARLAEELPEDQREVVELYPLPETLRQKISDFLPYWLTVPRRVSVWTRKISHDFRRTGSNFSKISNKKRLEFMALPIAILLILIALILIPGAPNRGRGGRMNTLSVQGFPVSIIYDQDEQGQITSAWMQSAQSARSIGQIEGLSYVSDDTFIADVDNDKKDDLLWRISFNNIEQTSGIQLWIGVLTSSQKIYLCSTSYEYTRWDSVPTKVKTPKSCALYISPTIPDYGKGQLFRGRECYPFIYTIKLTPEGPSFIPIPMVYQQLIPILRAVTADVRNPDLKFSYTNMLKDFNSLAAGDVPSLETVTNLTIEKLDMLPMK